MSKPRPFIRYNQSTSMQDSSDRTMRLKQRTMYAALANNVTKWGEKTNGSIKYLGNYKTKNVKYSEPTVTESGCLVNAPSSSSFLDLSKGMYYCHRNDIQRDYTMNLSGKSWQGPFLQIDTGMTPGVSTWFKTGDVLTAKFNAISTSKLEQEGDINLGTEQNLVDPNYDLFYEPCISEDNEPFRSYYKYANTEVYKDTYPYLEAIKKRYLKGFSFPSSVKFNYTEQLSGFKTPAQLRVGFSVSPYHSGTMTITLDNPGSGYTTPPTATLTADNTDWYGCATCDEEIIGTPSLEPIFTYDDCLQVDSSGGLTSQTDIGLTSQYPKHIFCNGSFNISIDDPPEYILGTPFQIYWVWTTQDVSGQWLSPQEPYIIDLDMLNSHTSIDSSLNQVNIVPDGIPSIVINPGYGGRGYSEDTIHNPIDSSGMAISFKINDVSCNTEVISLALSASQCVPFTNLPDNSTEWNYTYNKPPEKIRAIGYGTAANSLININITSGGRGYSLTPNGDDDGKTTVKLDSSGNIYEGGDLIEYANTILNDRLATNNNGQVTLSGMNVINGVLTIPCCTFNNIIGYSISLSETQRRYAKDIEQTCGPYCQETPKLCDPGDADSSYISCNADPKWNCCNTKAIDTLSPEPEPECAQFSMYTELQTAVNLWCSDLALALETYGNISCWDVSTITNMSNLFKYQTKFNDDISSWVVSSVTDMSHMFEGCIAYDQSMSWNVNGVTDMSYMFYNCTSFNQILNTNSRGEWNVSKVTDMSYMFSGCTTFNEGISNWDTSLVTDMSYMFYNCTEYDQDMPWNVEEVTDMSYMFYNCTAYDQPMPDWNVQEVTDMSYMFSGCTSFDQDIGAWFVPTDNVSYAIADMTYMFAGCSSMIFITPTGKADDLMGKWATLSSSPSEYKFAPTVVNKGGQDYIDTITNMFKYAHSSAHFLYWWNEAMDDTPAT